MSNRASRRAHNHFQKEAKMATVLKYAAFGVVALVVMASGARAQSCSGYTWTALTNGQPADADKVMNNFNCILASPKLKTGGGGLTGPQPQNYGNGLAQILSNNAGALGLEYGDVIPVVFLGVDRFPGCPVGRG
jgi:hypothetical protein